MASLDPDVSPAAAVRRHDPSDTQHDARSPVAVRRLDARDPLQGVSLQRPQRLLHQLRDGLPERGVGRWPLRPVAGRLAGRGTQRDVRDVWQ